MPFDPELPIHPHATLKKEPQMGESPPALVLALTPKSPHSAQLGSVSQVPFLNPYAIQHKSIGLYTSLIGPESVLAMWLCLGR